MLPNWKLMESPYLHEFLFSALLLNRFNLLFILILINYYYYLILNILSTGSKSKKFYKILIQLNLISEQSLRIRDFSLMDLFKLYVRFDSLIVPLNHIEDTTQISIEQWLEID